MKLTELDKTTVQFISLSVPCTSNTGNSDASYRIIALLRSKVSPELTTILLVKVSLVFKVAVEFGICIPYASSILIMLFLNLVFTVKSH